MPGVVGTPVIWPEVRFRLRPGGNAPLTSLQVNGVTPPLELIAAEYVAFTVPFGKVVAVIESPQTIRMSNVVGHIVPPNASSLGKVITAFQSQEQKEKLLRSYGFWRFTERSITDAMQLQQEFNRVRADKFATDREECVPDGICFGVPVFNTAGEVNVALSASLPKMRVRDQDHEKAIVAALRATADKISADFRAAQSPELASTSRGRR